MQSGSWQRTRNPKVALMPLIQGMLPSLKRAQRRIAEAVLDDPEQFVSHSISELAADYGVSAGSIVIFCKSLGLRGFPALKIAIARELSEPAVEVLLDQSLDDLAASSGGIGAEKAIERGLVD